MEENKWNTAKKELPGGLRLVRSAPKVDGGETSLLPAMKNMASVKVWKGKNAFIVKHTNHYSEIAQEKTGHSRQGAYPEY